MANDRLRIEYVPLSTAVLWERNPKRHDLGKMAESIQRHGFKDAPKYEPALNDGQGGIVDGNGRIETLQWMQRQGQDPPRGIAVADSGEWAVPIQFGVDAPSEKAAESYAVDANNLTMAGGDYMPLDVARMWDSDGYLDLLEELAADEALPVTMDGDDLDVLLRELGDGIEPAPDPGPQVDRAAELQEKWQVERGQVWRCSEIIWFVCGDCRDPVVWHQLMEVSGIDRVNGVFTSPPYAEQREDQYGGVPVDEYVDWWEAVQSNVREWLVDNGSFFVNIKPHCEDSERVLYVMELVLAMKRRYDWMFIDELCWDRGVGFPGGYTTRFKNAWEPIYHFANTVSIKFNPDNVSFFSDNAWAYDESNRNWNPRTGNLQPVGKAQHGKVRPTNIIRAGVPRAEESAAHPAKFPVALPEFFVKAYSDTGDVWADNFMGSGTTGVAAYQNGRRFVGIEKLEKYCAVTLERLSGMGLDCRLAE